MIESFKDKRTAAVFQGKMPKGFPSDIAKVARRKLAQLDEAIVLEDMGVPPGNHLEALTDDRLGQHSVRINNQWRLCFIWNEGNAFNVEILDYH